jgi:hypothetical protein
MHVARVLDFVLALDHGNSYTPLALDAMAAVTRSVRALDTNDLDGAARAASAAGYTLAPLVAGPSCHWVLEPPGFPGAIEQAVVLYAPAWRRNLVIETPHAREDRNTDAESAILYESVGAKALVVSGSHRCIDGVASSGCRPTSECSQPDPTTGQTSAIPPAESDPAHSIHNALNAAHLAFQPTDAVILQVHTNQHPEVNGDAMVSNGTRYAIAGTPADALFAALRAPDIVVDSCNGAKVPSPDAFCGEINVQSLASNGAADTCLGRSVSTGGASAHRFIHLEQSSNRMCLPASVGVKPECTGSFETWARRVGDALSAAIPEARP